MTVANTTWTATAPGSLMLMGEHAVLHGKRALVCAVNRFMRVRLTPRSDRRVHIQSALGDVEAELDAIEPRAPFQYVWTALKQFADGAPCGCDLSIESDFPDTIGFGSSAAVTVATLAALDALCGRSLDWRTLHERALDVIRSVQGAGSGADAAASVFGGLLEYQHTPRKFELLKASYPLTVVYSGYKTPTTEVIARVEAERRKRPALFDGFYYEIHECVRDAVDAICRDDWTEVGVWMDRNHALMDALGVNDVTLEHIVCGLREQPGILGAKISGSGLGDCVIGLGAVDQWDLPYEIVPCAMTQEGVRVEEG